jgi:hypothetical protein
MGIFYYTKSFSLKQPAVSYRNKEDNQVKGYRINVVGDFTILIPALTGVPPGPPVRK